jgi:hypothetical protein
MDNATLALSQLTDVEICAKDARCVREPRHAGLCLIVEDPTARALKLADRLEKEAARLAAEAAAWRAAEEAGVEAPGCGRHPLCIREPRHPGMCRLKGSKPGGAKPPAYASQKGAQKGARKAAAAAPKPVALAWKPTSVIEATSVITAGEVAASAAGVPAATAAGYPAAASAAVDAASLALAQAESDVASLAKADASPTEEQEASLHKVASIEDLQAEADAELEAELAAPAASQSKKRTADEAALGTQWYDVAAASSSDPAPVGAHAALAAAAAIADAAVGGSAMP